MINRIVRPYFSLSKFADFGWDIPVTDLPLKQTDGQTNLMSSAYEVLLSYILQMNVPAHQFPTAHYVSNEATTTLLQGVLYMLENEMVKPLSSPRRGLSPSLFTHVPSTR